MVGHFSIILVVLERIPWFGVVNFNVPVGRLRVAAVTAGAASPYDYLPPATGTQFQCCTLRGANGRKARTPWPIKPAAKAVAVKHTHEPNAIQTGSQEHA